MTIGVFQVGDKVRLSAAFSDINEAAADPGGVLCKVREPDGTVTTYIYGTDADLVKDSTGHYHLDFLTTQSGRHRYGFYGITSGQAVAESEFRVQPSKVQ